MIFIEFILDKDYIIDKKNRIKKINLTLKFLT